MSDRRERNSAPGVPRTPGSSPLWYVAAGTAVLLAFFVGLWFDRQDPAAAQGAPDDLPAGHPPVAEEAAASSGPAPNAGDYDPADPDQVWTASCAVCHGTDGEPTAAAVALGTPTLDRGTLAARSDADLERTIREGGEHMPAYDSKLPDATIRALVEKVRSLASP